MDKRLLTLILILFLLFTGLVVTTFFQMGKPIKNLFAKSIEITENQYLTSDTVSVLNLNTNTKKVLDLSTEIILSFRGINKIKTPRDVKLIKKLILQKKELYIIVNDTIGVGKNFKSTFPVYFMDTLNLPFNSKKLLYPYTIELRENRIVKIILGDLRKMFKNEKKKN
jgi:hypothetical protein